MQGWEFALKPLYLNAGYSLSWWDWTENLEQICIGRKFEKDKQWLLSKWLKKLQILKSWKMVRKISEKKRLDFGVPNEVLRDWIFWSIDGEGNFVRVKKSCFTHYEWRKNGKNEISDIKKES